MLCKLAGPQASYLLVGSLDLWYSPPTFPPPGPPNGGEFSLTSPHVLRQATITEDLVKNMENPEGKTKKEITLKKYQLLPLRFGLKQVHLGMASALVFSKPPDDMIGLATIETVVLPLPSLFLSAALSCAPCNCMGWAATLVFGPAPLHKAQAASCEADDLGGWLG